MREKTCCFTGHRPSRLPWRRDEGDPRCLALKRRLAERVERAYLGGWRHFICGMAQGCDLYFGEIVLELREKYPDVVLEAAVPCPTQAEKWPAEDRARHAALLERCDWETLVQRHYDTRCMMRRNRYMVDQSSLVIAVYDGLGGSGTTRTLAYAMGKKVTVDIIDLADFA